MRSSTCGERNRQRDLLPKRSIERDRDFFDESIFATIKGRRLPLRSTVEAASKTATSYRVMHSPPGLRKSQCCS